MSTINPLINTEAHLWEITISDFYPHLPLLATIISAEEIARANRYATSPLQHNFVITRGILRYLLAKYLDCNPKTLIFNNNTYGKPEVSFPTLDTKVHFNVSHSGDKALFAIACQELGVDIEKIKPDITLIDLGQRFFHPNEYRALAEAPQNLQTKIFFTLWTKKEAIIKAIGCGLSMSLANFWVDWQQTEQLISVDPIEPKGLQPATWKLTTLPVDNNYYAAIATSPVIVYIKHQQLQSLTKSL